MRHIILHASFHEGPRLDRVVVIVAERIGDRFRYDNRAGEMDDARDIELRDDAGDQILIVDVTFHQMGTRGDTAQRKPVERLSSTTTSSPLSTSAHTIWLPI